MVQIRSYRPADFEPLLSIFDTHVPAAFGPGERADYSHFLRTHTLPYMVAEHEGTVVGACGYTVRDDGVTGVVVWILTDRAARRQRVGTALMTCVMARLAAIPGLRAIECRTSQVAWRFFEPFGFRLQFTTPDYWAPGIDLYQMTAPPMPGQPAG
ncbi:hypothetical protein GCM10027578_25260 [Spirosoma luteolum]